MTEVPDVDDLLEGIVLSTLGPARGGRKVAGPSPVIEYVRDLTPADIETLNTKSVGAQPVAIQALRTRHHQLARVLADGTTHVEASIITGYSQSRISILTADPTFQQLVEYYRTQKDELYLDAHGKLATLGMTTVEIIQERLDDPDQAKNVSLKTLKELAEMAFDRSVAPAKGGPKGPGNSQAPAVAVNVTFAQAKPEGKPTVTIDLEPNEE